MLRMLSCSRIWDMRISSLVHKTAWQVVDDPYGQFDHAYGPAQHDLELPRQFCAGKHVYGHQEVSVSCQRA